jgi:hypothetical protein
MISVLSRSRARSNGDLPWRRKRWTGCPGMPVSGMACYLIEYFIVPGNLKSSCPTKWSPLTSCSHGSKGGIRIPATRGSQAHAADGQSRRVCGCQ